MEIASDLDLARVIRDALDALAAFTHTS
jgi:hypothetical protein